MYISGPGCQLTRLCTHGDRSTAGNSTMSKNCSKNETKRPRKAEKIKQKWGRSKVTLKWRSGFEKVWIELLQMTVPISEIENKYQKHYISIAMAKLKKDGQSQVLTKVENNLSSHELLLQSGVSHFRKHTGSGVSIKHRFSANTATNQIIVRVFSKEIFSKEIKPYLCRDQKRGFTYKTHQSVAWLF